MTEARGEVRDAGAGVGVADAVALGLAMLALVVLWSMQIFIAPRMLALYSDFAPGAALPALTQLVVRPIAVSIVSVVVLASGSLGLALRLTGRRGGSVLVLAPILAWLTVPVMLYGLYLPMFTLTV
jgi:hypothetical protein